MKKNNLIYVWLSMALLTGFSSCNKYLDVLPDNRAELNTTEKIAKLLVSAYPSQSYVLMAEFSSDNVDDLGPSNPNSTRFIEQVFGWQDITEVTVEDVNDVWAASYAAISNANTALQAIEAEGNPAELSAQRGEALLARAYNHFILVNMFAQNYATSFAETDLGITYMLSTESVLDPKYERHTVKEVYDFIWQDIEEGVPLINDASYVNSNVAKYHFNRAAAYTFAARVALFMENWQQAADYASLALNNNPLESLRDNNAIARFSVDPILMGKEFNSSSLNANFLVGTSISELGASFGPFYTNSRFNHSLPLALTETLFAPQIYGRALNTADYRLRVFVYGGTNLDKVFLPRLTYLFEFTNPVAQIGYPRTLYAPLTSEEALLTRAEANVLLKKYTEAIADIQIYVGNNTLVNYATISESSVNNWANSLPYYTPSEPTPKKKLNPDFNLEAGSQENLIHGILALRRFQFLHTGLRWFDVKRYGIEISRREIAVDNSGSFEFNKLANDLLVRDPRRAIQLPQDVISAGLTPNPR